MRGILLVSILLFSGCGPEKDVLESTIDKFGLVESRRVGNYGWRETGSGSYLVSTQSGSLEIKEHFPDIIREFPPYLETEYGSYTGSDMGEWGGELFFESATGQRELIIEDSFKSIVPFGSKVLVLAGLNHLGWNSGRVYEVSDISNPTEISRTYDLPNDPIETIQFRDTILVVGDNALIQIAPTFSVLLENPWKGIPVNSASVISDSRFIVGLNAGLAIVDYSDSEYFVTVLVDPENEQ